MNTTDTNIPLATCDGPWSAYAPMGLNIAIIAPSPGGQSLNNKNQLSLANAVKSPTNTNVNPPTGQAQLNIPGNLKASVHSNK